jgi:glycosyltransferase involved in cell wall biosynthesis
MKILQIIPGYIPAGFASGTIGPTHSLNRALVKQGVDVTVFTTNIDGATTIDVPLNEEVDIDGVKVFYFPITFRPWQYARDMRKTLAKQAMNYDLIHISGAFLSESFFGSYYARKYKKPYIISPHGSFMIDPLSRKALKKKIYINLFEKRILKNAQAIHFTIEKEKEDYIKAGFPLKKALIIPNGISIENYETSAGGPFRKKFGIDNDKKIILFLGRIHPIKGLDTLIDACAIVFASEPNAILVIAGPDENGYKKIIEAQILKNDIRDRVIFAGVVSGDDKNYMFKDGDVFALTSYSENFSMATIEAMQYGLPVVITEEVGVSPYIKQSDAGIVVKKTATETANAILKILSDKNSAEIMGTNGMNLVKKEFDSNSVAKRFFEAYKKIIGEHKPNLS